MKKKKFLTSRDRFEILLEREERIISSFGKNFNKIRRINEDELSEPITDLNVLKAEVTKGLGDYIAQNNLDVSEEFFNRLVEYLVTRKNEVPLEYIIMMGVNIINNIGLKEQFQKYIKNI